MKKMLFSLSILLILITVFSSSASAQGMMNWGNNSNTTSSEVSATAKDEEKGKQIWDQLQSKQINCNNLKDDDYEVLGEYFMGQSIGNTERHTAMNQMMKNMMGETGEEQMHIALSKRSSGCDTNASFPSGYGFMPTMLWIMGGGGNPMMGYGGWGGFGFGWIFMIIFWVLVVLGVIALFRYLSRSGQGKEDKTPLDILKGVRWSPLSRQ